MSPLPDPDRTGSVWPSKCGRPVGSRIVGGEEAPPQQWPWMVSLNMAWGSHFCGGSLITSRHVVTAAHCVSLFRLLTHFLQVRVGAVTARVSLVSIHPDYGRLAKFDSDLALLTLTEPVAFNAATAPACLPSSEAQLGRPAMAVGWGKVTEDALTFSSTLRQVEVVLQDADACSGYGSSITPGMLCAGVSGGGRDACHGDSGGPLLTQDAEGRWVLAGVVSFGRGCGRPDFPGVYVDLFQFRGWIAEVVG
ncbi:brain-specific serine protease 4-like [Penaeus japonicus]|uniref:brain-specific serine protease 4-like n=1 Tax=Penaeus japonicus TaxID=27405 RepID=UPI001C70B4C3|nr:brain-specific serine protease 4-like [Penaeus japonicus]